MRKMEELILEASLRNELGSAKVSQLRRKGSVPAIVYGAGKKSIPIQLNRTAFIRLLHGHRPESVVINLNIKDDPKHKNLKVMIKELQQHPVKGDVIHVDFNEISLTKVIKARVPVVTKGEAPGVKQEGGSLDHILWEIEVECLPTQIPKELVVDISNLKIGDSIAIKDIVFPEGVKVLHSPEAAVISVSAPIKAEEVVAAAEGVAVQEPEVIKEKKETEEGQESAETSKEKKEEKK